MNFIPNLHRSTIKCCSHVNLTSLDFDQVILLTSRVTLTAKHPSAFLTFRGINSAGHISKIGGWDVNCCFCGGPFHVVNDGNEAYNPELLTTQGKLYFLISRFLN